MKAVVLHGTGPIEELSEKLRLDDVPEPVAQKGEIVVKVKYSSLNRRDLWITKGMYSGIELPVIPGSDCAGKIHSVCDELTPFKCGDDVVIDPSLNWDENELHQPPKVSILGMPVNGTFAEFVKVPARKIHLKPDHLSFREASALPLAGVTAYRALTVKGRLSAGENVLITGIGGGVAALAMQFALAMGANVFVTSGSEDKISMALNIGAKAGALYSDIGWQKEILRQCDSKLDLIIDGTCGDTFPKLLETVSYGGRIVLYGSTLGVANTVNLHRVFWKQLSVIGSTMGSPLDFRNMLKFVEELKIIPTIDCEFDLENCQQAFVKMNNSEQFGKIVLRVE